MRRQRKQAGDTIVEVMIAMAVATAVLGSAYTITSKSLTNTRMAQEHSEALKIAQAQVEQIRAIALSSSANAPIFNSVSAGCIATSGANKGQLKQFTSTTNVPDPVSNYPSECKDIGSVQYRTGFKYNSANNTFSVFVNWDGANGVDAQVKSTYKAYPGV